MAMARSASLNPKKLVWSAQRAETEGEPEPEIWFEDPGAETPPEKTTVGFFFSVG
jgi:hypothetical protein